jgi:hypothetical protein
VRDCRAALVRDDRQDAVAGAVAHFQRAMMMDIDQAAKAMKGAKIEAEFEDFLEGFNQPTYRGMRVNGGLGSRSSLDWRNPSARRTCAYVPTLTSPDLITGHDRMMGSSVLQRMHASAVPGF